MTKTELIKIVATQTMLTQSQTKDVLNCFIAEIKAADKTVLSNFGTFTHKKMAASTGRHPKTQALLTIPERISLKFKASKADTK